MTDLNALMKQAQLMQEKMKKAQEEMAQKEETGESGAGLVKITMNGKYEVRNVTIDQSLLEEDRDVLEDLIAAAINDVTRKVAESSKNSLSGLAGGMNLPEGFKFPF